MSKGRSLSLIIVLLVMALITSGQSWFTVSMSPNDQSVVIQAFDGYSVFGWLSPLLMVILVGTGMSALVGARVRWVTLGLALLGSILLVSLSLIGVLEKNLTGVARQLEQATGIAATHGIKGLQIDNQFSSYLSIGVFTALAVAVALALISHVQWLKKPRTESRGKPKAGASDTISMWDQQR